MRVRARVRHCRAARDVLRTAAARIGHRTVGLAELTTRDAEQLAPEVLSGIEVESVVEVHPHAEASIVDLEVAAEPRHEREQHTWIGVGHPDRRVVLETLAEVQGHTEDQELALREPSKCRDAL